MIVGPRPEHGLRLVLERPRDGGPPWSYRGEIQLPERVFPAEARIEADGVVAVILSPSEDGVLPSRELHEKIRLLLRTVHRQQAADAGDAAPARKIVRWRGEK